MTQPHENQNGSEAIDSQEIPHNVEQRNAKIGRQSRGRLRFGLLELLLLTAVCATWLTVAIAYRQINQLQLDIQTLQLMTTDLIVMDEGELTLREVPSIWHEIGSWKYHAPPGADLELRFATEGLNDLGFPAKYQAVSLPQGQHSIHLKVTKTTESHDQEIYLDGELVLQNQHALAWLDSIGSTARRDVSDQSTSYSVSEPLKLRDKRYGIMHPLRKYKSNDLPDFYDSKGNLLWISPRSEAQEPASEFITWEHQQEFSYNVIGHRQGVRVRPHSKAETAGLINIQPSMNSVFGDQRNRYCSRLGLSVRPILNDASEPELPEEQANSQMLDRTGIVISYRNTIDPPNPLDDREVDTVTKKAISEDGKQMRIFAHYPKYPSGAQPIVEILFDAAYPDRIGFLPHAAPKSAPMKACQFVTRFGARFFWREIEMLSDGVANQDATSQTAATGLVSPVPLSQLYPQIDLSNLTEPDSTNPIQFSWQPISLDRLPRVKATDTIAEMFKMSLTTNVPDSSKLKFPTGLDGCMQYDGVPNRQIWWVPAAADKQFIEPASTIEIRATSVFPTTDIPLVGGPAVGNVRVTVPMPATEPVWLEIVAEPPVTQ